MLPDLAIEREGILVIPAMLQRVGETPDPDPPPSIKILATGRPLGAMNDQLRDRAVVPLLEARDLLLRPMVEARSIVMKDPERATVRAAQVYRREGLVDGPLVTRQDHASVGGDAAHRIRERDRTQDVFLAESGEALADEPAFPVPRNLVQENEPSQVDPFPEVEREDLRDRPVVAGLREDRDADELSVPVKAVPEASRRRGLGVVMP